MTRNKHHDTLKPIAGGNAGGSFGGGGTPIDLTNYSTTADTHAWVNQKLLPLISGIQHGAAVLDIVNEPTGNEEEGTLYIISATPTGVFASHANHIAFKDGAEWMYSAPQNDEAHLNEKDNQIYHWNGTKWNKIGSVDKPYPKYVFKDVKTGDATGSLIMAAIDVEAGHHYLIRGGVLAGYNNEGDRFTVGLREAGKPTGYIFSNTLGGNYKSSALIEMMSKPSTAGRVVWSLHLEWYDSGVILERYWLTVEDLGT